MSGSEQAEKNDKSSEAEKNQADYFSILNQLHQIMEKQHRLRQALLNKMLSKKDQAVPVVVVDQRLDSLIQALKEVEKNVERIETELSPPQTETEEYTVQDQLETLEHEKKVLEEYVEELEEWSANRDMAISVLETWIKTFEAERERFISEIAEYREKVEQWQALLEFAESMASSDKRYLILKVLAYNQTPVSISKLEGMVPGSITELSTAIDDLVEAGLIRRTENRKLELVDQETTLWLISE